MLCNVAVCVSVGPCRHMELGRYGRSRCTSLVRPPPPAQDGRRVFVKGDIQFSCEARIVSRPNLAISLNLQSLGDRPMSNVSATMERATQTEEDVSVGPTADAHSTGPFAPFPHFNLELPPDYPSNIYPDPYYPLTSLYNLFCHRCGKHH